MLDPKIKAMVFAKLVDFEEMAIQVSRSIYTDKYRTNIEAVFYVEKDRTAHTDFADIHDHRGITKFFELCRDFCRHAHEIYYDKIEWLVQDSEALTFIHELSPATYAVIKNLAWIYSYHPMEGIRALQLFPGLITPRLDH